jgi:hypothetical protein
VVHRTYEIGGRTVGIRSTSQAFGAWLDRSLAAYRSDVETEWTYSVVVPEDAISVEAPNGEVTRRRRLSILYWGIRPLVRTLDVRELARALLLQLEALLLPERDDAIYVRASLVPGEDANVLMPSQVTAYLHRKMRRRAERAHLSLPLAPFVAVDPSSGRVVPFRPMLRLPAEALEAFPGEGDGQYGEPVVETQIDVVWTVGSRTEVVLEPMTRGTSLRNLAGALVNLPLVGRDGLEGLGRLVQRAECYGVMPLGRPQIVDALAEAVGSNGANN